MSDSTSINIVIFVVSGVICVIAGFILRKFVYEKRIESARSTAKNIIDMAQREVDNRKREIDLEAKDTLYKLRQDFERENKEKKDELLNLEKRIVQKESNVDRRLELLEKKEKDTEGRVENARKYEESLKIKDRELTALLVEEKDRLQKISSLSQEEAKKLLLMRMEQELTSEKATLIRRLEDEAKQASEKKAQEIITLAIQRCAVEHTVESTVSVVALPSDEMKGRIIGREGRNIRALEMATGIDVIIDDTPEAVTLSGFDTVRREIARISLEHLISDGRIHPGRIEEVVEKVKKQMDTKIKEEGERAAFDVDIHSLNPELIKLLGRLKYRTSFGQNALQHSKEAAFLMGVMASELGLDFKLARRIGLLHDIGKAINHQAEGTHAKIGANLARKYGESEEVVGAIEAHHEEEEATSLFAILAVAADAISAARPGARRETLETYVKRLEKLESIANVFKGVDKAYAIQAGREVRVIVQPDKISDNEAINLSHDLRKKIEEEMEYPGQVKITVIREMRAIDYAK
ncbi:MAG: ribonuclease Y [Candidatus Omnitrophica bacterium CG11_big_fil_rev_8_21_14_0_20_42_13]|uniref:Ribonuclease Y n=1 Tax=Candidatus Ghiorseimicrobium undicola TaxID=1974746 RepID=A0A2H0LX82_9BACT|nr:MAG: ribonuclease Y [Candidatus Omnitrophica bacterium CG11_big_fil_rev_8_21_14_0_20_42_13]